VNPLRSRGRRWLSLVALITWPLRLEAQAPEEFGRVFDKLSPGESAMHDGVLVTLHRKQAGQPEKGGWYRAVSTAGGFRVRLPVPYNDFAMTAVGTDGTRMSTHVVGGVSADGSRFAALCMRRPDGAISPGWALKTAEAMVRTGVRKEQRPVEAKGMKGFEVRMLTEAPLYLARFLAGHGAACTVSVEHSPGMTPAVEKAARQFLDSFEVDTARPPAGH
jgi:hypothetical protein